MGFGPRFADFDKDGVEDIVSGSYTKGLYFFRGLGAGKYAAAKHLTQTGGQPVSKEYAQSPCMGDWDGDGDYDMALGVIHGAVKLYTNNGDMTFTEVGPFLANGKEITAGDGGPCIVDWDSDGTLDLLVGDSEGNVKYYRGTAKGARELVADENSVIIEGLKGEAQWTPRKPDPGATIPFTPKRPGVRVKPYAADWNNDGKLDLLVGDFVAIEPPAKKLTAAEQKRLAQLEAKAQTLQKPLMNSHQRFRKQAEKSTGLNPSKLSDADMKKWSEAYTKAMNEDKEYQSVQKQMRELYPQIAKLKAEPEMTGVVWVYLRK